jgi:stage V sporulation protein S
MSNVYEHPDLIVSGQVGRSDVNALAGALTSILREKGVCSIQAMGADAVNKAVKAIIVANGYVSTSGMEVENKPHFITVDFGGGDEKTAIRWNCRLVKKG